jgi:hypothetical protein
LLGVAAAFEAVTGLVLLVAPQLLIRLLLGADVAGAGIVIGRVAGIALFALGFGCWLERREAEGRGWALVALLTYNILVTVYLVAVGLGGEFVGLLLWPAAAVHAILTVLLGYARLKHQ